ncbi:uncharacterized protein LOC118439010 [Folsomia candida]|uniref:uncharacterized protein LOC118439010 n=1 Tax=Folsomia candida TaxID=158441 RepID=UPI0016054E2F|nr:uncharacterized protein LOC118439010 [Folsomia candida]
MSKFNSNNVKHLQPILSEVFTSKPITFDFSKFKEPTQATIFETNVLDVYKIFHNICYYICIMPFKIVYEKSVDGKGEVIQFQESKFQKRIFFLLHITHFFYALPHILGALQGTEIQYDPSQFYHLLARLTGFFMVVSFSIGCMRQSRLKSFLTKVHGFRQTSNGQHDRSKLIYSLMTIPFGLVLMYTFSYQRDRLDFSSWENLAESGIQVIINHVKFWDTSEFLRHNGTTPDMRNVDIGWKLALTIVHICLIVFDYVLAILLEVLVFIMCFIVYRIGYDFYDRITLDSDSMNLEKLTQCYNEVKSIMHEINWTFGYLMLVFILAAIPYYGVHMIEIFSGTWNQRIETVYFVMLYSVALLLAAEGHRKFQQFSEFIFDNYKQIGTGNREEVSILIAEVTNTQIGFKGFGFFTISYGFLGNVLGLVFTHVIIMLQFKTAQKY